MIRQHLAFLLLLVFLLTSCFAEPPTPLPPPPDVQPADPALAARLVEGSSDDLGLYQDDPGYQEVVEAGGIVINVPELDTFFVLWLPDNDAQSGQRRLMAVVPGSQETAYQALAQRLRWARQYDYALVVVQGQPGQALYLEPEQVYTLLSTALEYVGAHYGADIHRSAYEGSERGSEMAYQIAYHDRDLGSRYFSLFICHSGGISKSPSSFVRRLQAGQFGENALEGKRFFLYCGQMDPNRTCREMRKARDTIEEYGGTVERLIEDDDGQRGLLENEASYREAVETWLSLSD